MGTLGCPERYDAAIHWQGGKHLFSPLEAITAVSWGRKLDDYSEASVTLAKRELSPRCWNNLAPVHNPDGSLQRPGIEPWAHELSIYRDRQLVWQGPIVDWTETGDTLEINARDMLAWMDRRVIAINLEGNTPDGETYRGETGAVLQEIFSSTWPGTHETNPWDNPGITEHARIDPTPGRFTETEVVWKGSRTVGDLVRDIITNGTDLFTVGRMVFAIPDYAATDLSRPPYRLTEQHFENDLEVRKLGLDMATEGFVVSQPQNAGQNSAPLFGKWPPQEGPGGPDNPCTPAWIGRVTRFHEATSLSGSGQSTPQPALVDVAHAIRDYGFPCPLALVIPSQASLSPTAPIEINELVPGRAVSVELTSYVHNVSDLFRINEIEVSWTGGSGGGGTSGGSSGAEQVQIGLVTLRQPPLADETGSSGATTTV